MSGQPVPLEKLFKQMAETMQAEQNKFDQAVYQSASPTQKKRMLQNCYDNGIKVPDISKKTGVLESTIYTKIKTRGKK